MVLVSSAHVQFVITERKGCGAVSMLLLLFESYNRKGGPEAI